MREFIIDRGMTIKFSEIEVGDFFIYDGLGNTIFMKTEEVSDKNLNINLNCVCVYCNNTDSKIGAYYRIEDKKECFPILQEAPVKFKFL